MPVKARIWVTLFLLLGICGLAVAFGAWHTEHPLRFALFAVVAMAGSAMQAATASARGKVWSHQLFVIFGMLELSLPETAFAGCCCLAIECIWQKSRRVSLLDVYFNLANLAVSLAIMNRMLTYLRPFGPPEWALAGTAGFVLFAFTTFPLAGVTALSEDKSVIAVWVQNHAKELPTCLAAALIAWMLHTISIAAGWETALLGLPVIFLLYRTYRLHIERIEEAKIHAEHLAIIHMRTIEALALAIEAKDATTSDHLRRVQVYAVETGARMGMSENELTALRAAAILHDIGKLAVPEYIISKPGRLTPEEFARMKIHPIIGAEILEHVNFPYPVVPIVRAHHEKWNGKGYPHGLKGAEIPLGARILSAVDTLDALASDRQYRRALPLDEAMTRISDEAGSSFDPAVVEVLRNNYIELEKKAQAAESKMLKLSLDLKVERGEAPGAGFEQARQTPAVQGGAPTDFLEAISQARRDVDEFIDSGLTAEEFFALFTVRVGRLIPYDTAVIWLRESGRLKPAYIHGIEHAFFATLAIPEGEGLSGWVAENRKPVVNGNPAVESGYLNDSEHISSQRSALSAPIERSGESFGAITLYQTGKDAFSQDHMRMLRSLAPRFAAGLAAARTRAAQPVPSEGQDAISFLRNLADELRRNSRLNTPMSVIVCSLEGARHLSGEMHESAVRHAQTVIAEHLGSTRAITRIGHREFAAITASSQTRQGLTRVNGLRQALTEFDGVSIAAGEAVFPADGRTPEELFAAAESRVAGPVAGTVAQSAGAVASGWVQ